MIALLNDGDPRVRLAASEKILAGAFRGAEYIDIEDRICVLEQLAEKQGKNLPVGQ